MGAIFFKADGQVYTISNSMSINKAGFKFVKAYYNRFGMQLEYYIRNDGIVLERSWSPRRQAVLHIYETTEEANRAFSRLQRHPHVVNGKIVYSEKATWDTGKYVPKKDRR